MTDLQRTLVSNEVMQQIGIDLCNLPEPEAVVRRCFVEKVFLEISRNSQENTCARASFLINLQALDLQLYQKETLTQVLPANFAKFLRTPFFTEHLQWLLLLNVKDLNTSLFEVIMSLNGLKRKLSMTSLQQLSQLFCLR